VFIHAMPRYIRKLGAAGVKWVIRFPENRLRQLAPYQRGFDPELPGDRGPIGRGGLCLDHGHAHRGVQPPLRQVLGQSGQHRRPHRRPGRAGPHPAGGRPRSLSRPDRCLALRDRSEPAGAVCRLDAALPAGTRPLCTWPISSMCMMPGSSRTTGPLGYVPRRSPGVGRLGLAGDRAIAGTGT